MDITLDKQLQWIDRQLPAMTQQLQAWGDINSGSDNLQGLQTMLEVLRAELAPLADTINEVPLPPRPSIDHLGNLVSLPHGKALHATKRPNAPLQLFLGGHMDTVYPASHPFQRTTLSPSENILRGPGVADMKGGLIVMLTALKALEGTSFASTIGWEVVINPDEEVGSIGSQNLLISCARRVDFALLFEPSFSDGAIVDTRKGSLNCAVVARGRAAHAGRDFHTGYNAITSIAKYILSADKLNSPSSGVTINFGRISGGGPLNIVPDCAVCHINARATKTEDFAALPASLKAETTQSPEEFPLEFHLLASRKPKEIDPPCEAFFDLLKTCYQEENTPFIRRPSGGVCDGNIFAAEGVPSIDTLGVVGGAIHTTEEYMVIDSLTARTRITLRLLAKLATNHKKITKREA